MSDQLGLPEPAATLLRKTHAILDEHVTPHTPGGEGWKLGGGTVLAARWEHRDSFDLDIQIHPETERAHLERKANPELWRKMYAAGATRIDMEATPTIIFGEGGRIEFVEARPIPRKGHRVERLPSGTAVLLASSQILAGKLIHRGTDAPVRDLYDLAVARTADLKATAIAVNALRAFDARTAASSWARREKAYRNEAQTELHGVPPQYAAIAENPALHARQTLLAARYTGISIAVGRSGIVVRVRNREFERQLVYKTREEARHGFEEAGVNAAIRARGLSPGRILNESNNALDAGREATILALSDQPGEGPGGTRARGPKQEKGQSGPAR